MRTYPLQRFFLHAFMAGTPGSAASVRAVVSTPGGGCTWQRIVAHCRYSLLACTAAFLLAMPVYSADYYAAQVSASSEYPLPAGGMDAMGGVGDWLLSDGDICAVISDSNHASFLAAEGGALIDLWHCDAANDQWSVSHAQLNLQKDQIPPTDTITAGTQDGAAWIEVAGRRNGLHTAVRYQLAESHPGALLVESTVSRVEEGPRLGMFGAIILHPGASLRPFALDSQEAAASRGFQLDAIDTTKPASILSSVSASDTQILIGSRHIAPGITYGVRTLEALHIDTDGRARPVTPFMLGGREFSLFGAFTQPFPGFWSRTPGMISFALGQIRDLGVGETFVYRQSIAVNRHADAAVVTDQIYRGAVVSGTLNSAQAGITVTDDNGTPITFVRPADHGGFSFRLPRSVDSFRLVIETPWGQTQLAHTTGRTDSNATSGAADIDLGAIDLGAIDLGEPAQLLLPRGRVMSLMLLQGDERTLFNSELSTLTVGNARALGGAASYRISLAGSSADLPSVALAPGQYRVIASRGPEYSVTETQLTLSAGQRHTLEIADPVRQVDSSGLIGVDLHVHSGISFDSSLPLQQRVKDFVAQGGEVLVPTEHNVTYDFGPIVEAMGLDDKLLTFPGVEITGMARSAAAPTTIGHSNVFPVAPLAGAFMGGTLPFEGKRLGQVIADYKAAFPQSIFQLNHPRTEIHDDDVTFFNHLSQGVAYDPALPVDAPGNHTLVEPLPGTHYRDIDFDAIELLNGPSMDVYALVREDWFSLLRQNFYKVATANSDSHSSHETVAFPRNYVVVARDDPAQVGVEEIVSAIKRGAVYGSTGPIIRVDIDGAGPGDTHPKNAGMLNIHIDHAPWVPVAQIRVWLNGELWQTLPVDKAGTTSLPVVVERDSFVFVEVYGQAQQMYARLLPGFTPFAFANPVFMDVAGDGWQYDAGPQASR